MFGSDLFTPEYFREHQAEFGQVYGLLADDKSRQIYADLLAYKLSGKLEYLYRHMGSREEDFGSILTPGPGSVYVDLGAYDGDTVEEFIRHCPDYGLVSGTGARPQELPEAQAAAGELPRTTLVPKGSYSGEGAQPFSARGGRNSALAESGKKLRPVELTSVDALLRAIVPTILKMDVEGVERETLLGCRETIYRWKPQLSVAAYHRTGDLWELPLLVRELGPDYRLYLRRHKYVRPGRSSVRHIRATVVHKWIVILHKNLQTFTE